MAGIQFTHTHAKRINAMFLLATSASFLLSGCQSKNEESKRTSEIKIKPPAQVDPPREALPWNRPITLLVARDQLRNKYRLKPDKRFIESVSMIERLTHSNPGTTKVEFVEHNWRISVEGQTIGEVAEFADFGDRFRILSLLAQTLVKKNKVSFPQIGPNDSIVAKLVAEGTPAKLLDAITQTDRDWQMDKMSSSQLASASSALSLVAWEMEDRLDIGDPIFTKALSYAAISDAVGNSTTEDRAILAHQMGYHNDAKALVQKLPDGNIFRLYLDKKKEKLIDAMKEQPSNFKTSFCLLNLLADELLEAEWRKYAPQIAASNSGSAVPILKTFLAFGDEQSVLPVALDLLNTALAESGGASEKPAEISWSNLQWSFKDLTESTSWQLKNLLDEFEQKQIELDTDRGDTLSLEPAPASLNKVFYRAAFYSGVELIANAYVTLPYAASSTRDFLNSLKTDKTGAPNELITYVTDIIGESHKNASEILQDATKFSALGPKARATVFKSLGSFYENAHSEILLQGGPSVFQCMDDRPSNRQMLSLIALKSLMDLSLQHRLFIGFCNAGEPTSFSERFNSLIASRDFISIYNLVSDKKLPYFMRYKLVEFLRINLDYWQKPNSLESIYQKLVDENPHDFEVANGFYQYLVKSQKYAQARELMKRWISEQKSFRFLDLARAQTNMARASFEMRQYQLAMQDLGKAATSGYEEAFAAKIAILQELGKDESAEQWSKEFLQRHPNDLTALSLYCQCLWKKGKYVEAAKLLHEHHAQLSAHFWRHSIGTTLARVFAKEPQKLKLAIQALKQYGFTGGATLGQIANQFYAQDLTEEAFQILVAAEPQPDEISQVATNAYRYLKRWRGRAFALDWLKKEVPLEHRSALAAPAFLTGQYELLTDFIPSQNKSENISDDVNLMRTAAELVKPNMLSAAAKKSVETAFATQTAAGAVGRLLLHKDDSIDNFKLYPSDRCAASFYVGWKNLASSEDFYDGCEWLRVSLDDNQTSVNQYYWSSTWLSDIDLSLMQYPVLTNNKTTRYVKISPPSDSGSWNSQRRFGLRFTDVR